MIVQSLNNSKFRRTFMTVYALMALLPLLALIYFLYEHAYPMLAGCGEALAHVKETVSYILVAMVVLPLTGYLLMINWVRDLEDLTNTVRSKASEFGTVDKNQPTENEMAALKNHFEGLYGELQDKIRQINDYSNYLIDTNIRLAEESITDPLTGLYNRRHFEERLAEEAARASRHQTDLSVIMIDVDGFKNYNDTLGHPAGDSLLRNIGRVIRALVRKSDICFRYGGDEFSVVLPQCGVTDAEAIASKLVQAVSGQVLAEEGHGEVSISISCGVADLRVGLDRIVDVADQCLLKAKAAGKGRIITARPAKPAKD